MSLANAVAANRLLADNTARKRLDNDVVFTIVTQSTPWFTAPVTVVWSDDLKHIVKHCIIYVLEPPLVDYSVSIGYTEGDNLSIALDGSGGNQMARKQNDDLLIEDELAAAFLNDDELTQSNSQTSAPVADQAQPSDESWDDEQGDFPGQLAVDVYETDDRLVVKARTAGVNKEDLDVSISDGILTISGTLSSGDDTAATNWHIQECYWGEFSRTVALPVAVKEDEANAALKDGVLSITFPKVQQEQAKKIAIQ